VNEPASVAGVATVQLSAATEPTDQQCGSCSSDIWETLAVEDMAEQVNTCCTSSSESNTSLYLCARQNRVDVENTP